LELQRQQLIKLTGVAESPIGDLSTLENIRVDGSGRWLLSNEVYISWREDQDVKRRIFYLTAKPGSGKSVLSSQVITNLRDRELKCCYYFFKRSNATKSTISGCLRSLAYQMASNDNTILKRLCEFKQEATSWEQWDERMIWQKLFLGCIFKDHSSNIHFWVIDALDECHLLPLILSLFAEIPPRLRIFITSGKSPELDNCLVNILHFAEHYQVKAVDTLKNLEIFIDSKMHLLPAGDENGQRILKQRILAKASGSFLWVSLVVKELQQAYSEESAADILSDLSTDMNEFYSEMLENVSAKGLRITTLAKAVFMWALLSSRPLTVDELQYVIKLDINQTVHNLGKFISAICGQLLSVNQKDEVEAIHQTAMSFLLQQHNLPSLKLEQISSHTRMAQICLKILTEDMQQWHPKGGSLKITTRAKFLEYACEYFSDHIKGCSSEDPTIWDALLKFLDGNLLLWIEHLAEKRRLGQITQTAHNLQAYLRRRVKCLPPLSPPTERLDVWITDLIRLSAKFGPNIDISPSSIHDIVPKMCPLESLISKTYRSLQPGLCVKGELDKIWDDCLVRIHYPTHTTTAVAYGEHYIAVSASDGTIFLYYKESNYEKYVVDHGERPKSIIFSSRDEYMASSGLRKVKVWNTVEKSQIWSFDMDHEALTLLFINGNVALTAATKGNYTITWELLGGIETERWQWTESVHSTALFPNPRQIPRKALFSPDYTALIVNYRGLPLYLFAPRTKKFIGCCSREDIKPLDNPTSFADYSVVDALAFNPNPEINNLVVSYGFGEIAVYDMHSTDLCFQIPGVYAHHLACSHNGRTLVTGNARGTIQIFEFVGARGGALAPIYKICPYEDGIQGIVFSSDGLVFADILRSQLRIWKPAVLSYSNVDKRSQSEFSQARTLEPPTVTMRGHTLGTEITSICFHPDGDFVFCGKQSGAIAYFETDTATQRGILYCHSANVRIVCIAYIKVNSLLITGDEAGRVLLTNIDVSRLECKTVSEIAEIRLKTPPLAILVAASGSKILFRSRISAEVWTIGAEKVGATISHEGGDKTTIVNHPVLTENFIIIDHKSMRIYSWTDSLQAKLSTEETAQALNFTVTRFSQPFQHPIQDWQNEQKYQQSSRFIAHLFKGSADSTFYPDCTSLQVWPANNISVFESFPLPISIPGFDKHSNKILQIISVAGNLILFLDKDLWVCSLDVSRITASGHGAKRHFFLLSEWQRNYEGFIIEYIPSRYEFVVAVNGGIVIINRGLELEAPWFS
jgi:WD40 repeat protein